MELLYNYRLACAFLVAVVLTSCQSYRPLDLKPKDVLQELEVERNRHSLQNEITFQFAAQLMANNNLSLKRLQQKYEGMQAVAGIKTPLPNPEIEFGVAHGSKLAEKTASATQPFVGLGFSIPLGPRLRRNDELNHLKALKAYNEQLIKHRLLYFQLSKTYVELALIDRVKNAQETISKTLEIAERETRRRHELGDVDKLDVTTIGTQLAKLELERMDVDIELQEKRGGLAKLLGISSNTLMGRRTQVLPSPRITKTLEELKALLLDNNLDLAGVEMDFHASDGELRLELAKQYPDLHVGFSQENEVGERTRTLSIPFSIEIPVFDRNRQDIAMAFSKRKEGLCLYKERLHGFLVELETSYRQYILTLKKLEYTNKHLLPLANEAIRNAERSLKVGAISSLRYLDILAEQQDVLLDRVQLENECWSRLQKIESLIGMPLVQLQTASMRPLSETLRAGEH